MPTLYEIVKTADTPQGFHEVGELRLNGDLVPRSEWARVRPKAGPRCEVAITLHMPMGQGGQSGSSGGGKNTVALVATIAVLLAAVAVSGGAAAPLLGAGFAAGAFGAAALGVGISVGGALAVAALFPPPALSPNQTQPVAASDNPTASVPAALTGNALAPGTAVARVPGTMRVFPPLLSMPLVELIGSTEYAEAVFGLSGPHSLSAIWAGGVDVSTMQNLDIELQDGSLAAPIQTLVTRQGYTATPNATLSAHQVDPNNSFHLANQAQPETSCPQWQGFVSRDSPDEIWLNLGWGQGLFDTNSPTTTINEVIRTRIRLRGQSAWINMPEVHFSQSVPVAFQKVIRIIWGARPVAPNLPPTVNGPIYAFKHVPGQDGSTVVPATAGWTADPSFSAGAGNDLLSNSTVATSNVLNTELYADKAIFYLDPSAFPQGIYEIQMMRSCDYLNSNFTPSTYMYSAGGASGSFLYDFFLYQIVNGIFFLATDDGKRYDAVAVTRVSSVWNQNPIESKDFATISIRVSGQTLGELSVLASGLVYDWDGTGWNTFGATSNPAPHFRDILRGNMGASPLPAALVDDVSLLSWRAACISLGYECNVVLEGKTYTDALNVVASSGYARLRNSETWGVILDRDRSAESAVQIFTPRNMQGFSWTRPLAKLPTGFRASFFDRDAGDYSANSVIVYADPANADASQLQQIQYDGLVTTAEVTKRAAFDLAQADLRFTFYSGVTDLESIVCQRGDLVGVQHDILDGQAGFARIASVQESGGVVTGLTLEGTVPVDTELGLLSSPSILKIPHLLTWGARTGIAIRLKGGAGVMVQEITAIANGDNSVVTFLTPFPDPGTLQLDRDCLCAVGPLGSEYRRLLVYSIIPKDATTATITFVDEAPDLWPGAGRLTTESSDFISTDDGFLLGVDT